MPTLTPVTSANIVEQIQAIVKTHRDDLITDLRNGVDSNLITQQYNYFALVGDLGDRFPSLTRDELHASVTKAIDAAKQSQTPKPWVQPIKAPSEITTELLQQAQQVAIRFARRKVKDVPEDIAQDAVIQVWRTYSTFDPSRSTFKGWVRMITKSQCHKYRQGVLSEHNHRDHLENLDVATTHQASSTLASRLPEMSDLDQRIVESVLAGNSVTETADNLGLTRKAVRYRLARLGKE